MKKEFPKDSSSLQNNAGELTKDNRLEVFNMRHHMPHRYFKDDHLDPAAGDYEPILSYKQSTLLTAEQRTSALVAIVISYESLTHNRE